MMRNINTKELVEIALFAAVLCVIAPFAVPVPVSPVPLSLATFIVYLAAVLLGAKQSAWCVLIYLLLGMVGLPVFSGFSGGIGVLFGPTGGYLIGYLPCVWIVGRMAEAKVFSGRQFLKHVLAMFLGTLACYVFGTIWFLFVMGGSYTVAQAILVCVVPYLAFDFVKILVAAGITETIKKILKNVT